MTSMEVVCTDSTPARARISVITADIRNELSVQNRMVRPAVFLSPFPWRHFRGSGNPGCVHGLWIATPRPAGRSRNDRQDRFVKND
jgi:hypothetical protein